MATALSESIDSTNLLRFPSISATYVMVRLVYGALGSCHGAWHVLADWHHAWDRMGPPGLMPWAFLSCWSLRQST